VIKHEKRQGLAFAVGKWKGFEEVGEQIGDLHQLRSNGVNSKLSKLTKGGASEPLEDGTPFEKLEW